MNSYFDSLRRVGGKLVDRFGRKPLPRATPGNPRALVAPDVAASTAMPAAKAFEILEKEVAAMEAEEAAQSPEAAPPPTVPSNPPAQAKGRSAYDAWSAQFPARGKVATPAKATPPKAAAPPVEPVCKSGAIPSWLAWGKNDLFARMQAAAHERRQREAEAARKPKAVDPSHGRDDDNDNPPPSPITREISFRTPALI